MWTRRQVLGAVSLASATLLSGCAGKESGAPLSEGAIVPLPRGAWARGEADMSRVEPMNEVRMITVMDNRSPEPFTATGQAETAEYLENLRAYQRSRNLQDIGYHFGIDRAGRVWALRDVKYQGQCVRYNNEHNVGVCVLGNYSLQTLTATQKMTLPRFLHELRMTYGVPIRRIFTKREIVTVENPGEALQSFMMGIRQQKWV